MCYKNIKILYEDKELIVLDKPSDLVVHPGAGQKNETLVDFLKKKYKLTTGLKCAPEILEKIEIIMYKMAPVAIAFASNTIPSFEGDRFSAIIPEPTTAKTNINVPRYSDISFCLLFIY